MDYPEPVVLIDSYGRHIVLIREDLYVSHPFLLEESQSLINEP